MSNFEVYLTTLFSGIICFNDFFGGTGQTGQTDKQTDKQTDIRTDRLFLENIILDVSFLDDPCMLKYLWKS